MKRSSAKLIALVVGLLLWVVLAGCTQRENPALPEGAPQGYVFQQTHDYAGLDDLMILEWSKERSRWLMVYTPYGYGADVTGARYPTLYLLPGYDGEPTFIQNFGNENYYLMSALATVADRLIADGEIKPMIIAMPDASIWYGGAFYTDSPLAGKWEEMMSDTLVALIDATYRTIVDRDSRAIGGHSSGGYGAVKIAMKHPQYFASVSCIDGPLAFAGSGTFKGLQELFDDYLNESGITGDSAEQKFFDTDTVGFRQQPFKILFYSMAATFSPTNRPIANRFDTLHIDLPFNYQGNIVDSTWNKWMKNDLLTLIGDSSEYQDNLRNHQLYFETSSRDVNLFNQQTKVFQDRLQQLGIPFEAATFAGYNDYGDRSRAYLYDRFEKILKFHNRYLKDRFGNY